MTWDQTQDWYPTDTNIEGRLGSSSEIDRLEDENAALRKAVSKLQGEVLRLERVQVLADQLPEGFDLTDNATVELAVECSSKAAALEHAMGLLKCAPIGTDATEVDRVAWGTAVHQLLSAWDKPAREAEDGSDDLQSL